MLGELALLAEADCAAVFCGSLRAAFMLEADWAVDCEEAADMGVSRMESRISLLISCSAESSPFSEMVSCSLLPTARLPVITQFF